MNFIRTIEEDEEIADESEDLSSDEEAVVPKAFPSNRKKGHSSFDTEFEFTEKFVVQENEWTDGLEKFVRRPTKTTLKDKIVQMRKERKKRESQPKVTLTPDGIKMDDIEKDNTTASEGMIEDDEEVNATDSSSDEDADIGITELNDKWDEVRNKASSEKIIKRNKRKEAEENPKAFFEELPTKSSDITSFDQMNLSRPLLKAINSMNFRTPTPIQSSTIPVALLGKDICACAATGTGKTAAFMLPVLERLLYKPRQAPVSRVLVLVPTRELGVQVFQVTKLLGQFTAVETCLVVGGLDVKIQEASLRRGPDIVIATPGRLIDHLHNAPSFDLHSIEILILDEADRMLDEYFDEQMSEIIKMCSVTRQTMLFSATMTDKVRDLALVSLKNPVRIFVNENTEVAFNLRQEFIRIRKNREGDREAIVAALCCRTFHDHCLVFVQTKKQAHRLHIVLGLLGLNVGELHGNLSQPKRLESLRQFKEAQIDIMVATDLASRGLDIEGVKTVINFTMPNTSKHYVHRVGRTARAGKSGRSVSLIGESERKMLKEVIKQSKQAVKSRVIPQEVIQKYRDRVRSLKPDMRTILNMEWEEKQIQVSEKQVHKAEKILKYQDEITSRPKRIWFQTHKERKQLEASKRLDGGPNSGGKGKKRRRGPTAEETEEEMIEKELVKTQQFAARNAKRVRRGKRPQKDQGGEPKLWIQEISKKMKEKKQKEKERQNSSSKSSFARELTSISEKSVREIRNRAKAAQKEELLEKKRKSKGFKKR